MKLRTFHEDWVLKYKISVFDTRNTSYPVCWALLLVRRRMHSVSCCSAWECEPWETRASAGPPGQAASWWCRLGRRRRAQRGNSASCCQERCWTFTQLINGFSVKLQTTLPDQEILRFQDVTSSSLHDLLCLLVVILDLAQKIFLIFENLRKS